MPKVLNAHHTDGYMPGIYVGRPTKWGNPFAIGKDGDRVTVVRMYRKWLQRRMIEGVLNPKAELRGQDLVCWCAPLPCHADVLLEYANES